MTKFVAEKRVEPIFKAANYWQQNCMQNDSSVFTDKSLWNLTNFAILDDVFVKNSEIGEGTYFKKLETQLSNVKPEVKQLVAEMMWVFMLCPSNITIATKRKGIRNIWDWSGEDFPKNSEWLEDNVLSGIGSAGMGFNTNRWREMGYFNRVMIAFKSQSPSERGKLLLDGWQFAKWLENIQGSNLRQFRHMILFLLYPDKFERIFSGGDRRKIVQVFSKKSKAKVNKLSALNIDNELYSIRKKLTNEFGTDELDFYVSPLIELWKENEFEAQEVKSEKVVVESKREASIIKNNIEEFDIDFFSSTVRSVRNKLEDQDEITATLFVQAIINHGHKGYGKGMAGSLELDTNLGEKRSADDWLQNVYSYYIDKIGPFQIYDLVIDGRLTIWALVKLDPDLRSHSNLEKFLIALRTELDKSSHVIDILERSIQNDDLKQQELSGNASDAFKVVENKTEEIKLSESKDKSSNILLTDQLISAHYASDDPDADDLMGIEDEVKSFARYVAKRNLTTPLAIGLFGDWGSGKTFFMRKMQRFVEELEGQGRIDQEHNLKSSWCSEVIQIEFNAWHYIETNLWASLVEHIFCEMEGWLTREGKYSTIDQLYEVFESAQEVKREAEDELKEAVGACEDANNELIASKNEYQSAVKEHRSLSASDIWSVVTASFSDQQGEDQTLNNNIKKASETLGVDELRSSAKKLHEIVGQASDVTGRSRILLSSLFSRKRNFWQYSVLILLIALTPLVMGAAWSWVVSIDKVGVTMQSIGAGVIELSALITVITGWGAAGLSTANNALVTLEKADADLKEIIEKKSNEQRERLAVAESMVATTEERVTLAEQRIAQAIHTVDKARQQLKAETPRARLTRFLRRRLENAEYAKHLGVISMIRKDFDFLSRIMTGEGWTETDHDKLKKAGIELKEAQTFQRIILYVDDLDRCPADRVVEVLQAVHLLLAFPLFVVVVGVDARWVSRALGLRYQHLLTETVAQDIERAPKRDDGKEIERNMDNNSNYVRESLRVSELIASSHDYLEKIFQVPYWVKPMDQESSKVFIEKLARLGLQIDSEAEQKNTVSPDMDLADDTLMEKSGGQANDIDIEKVYSENNLNEEDEQENEIDVYEEDSDSEIETSELTLVELPLTEYEIEFMKILAPYIGRSPRRSKRFFNVYQLVRAGLNANERTGFIGDHGDSLDYKVLMCLLAIVTGSPILAPQFIAEVVNWGDQGKVSLSALIKKSSKDDMLSNSTEWARLSGALEVMKGLGQDQKTFERVRYWSRRAMRFSFTARPV